MDFHFYIIKISLFSHSGSTCNAAPTQCRRFGEPAILSCWRRWIKGQLPLDVFARPNGHRHNQTWPTCLAETLSAASCSRRVDVSGRFYFAALFLDERWDACGKNRADTAVAELINLSTHSFIKLVNALFFPPQAVCSVALWEIMLMK